MEPELAIGLAVVGAVALFAILMRRVVPPLGMRRCPACKEHVSEKAAACVKCGEPLKAKS